MREEFLWVEKYRPKTVDSTVLPKDLKKTFQTFVDNKNVPNLILSGGPGIGKTTIARAMLEELGCSYIVINGSLDRNIDTLRNEIQNFASSMSMRGGRKYVILDEADYLNPNSTQPALRNFIEEYSKNCGFILTCNYLNKIIPPLHSRCSVIDFTFSKDQKPKLGLEMYKRVLNILDKENVEYETKVVAALVTKHFPDNRRILNELQRYSATGRIDSGVLANFDDGVFKELFALLKDKKFTDVRKWVGEHSDIETTYLYKQLYIMANDFVEPSSVPQLVLILADYQHRAAFVADPEINNTACLVEIMANCRFS